MRKPKEWLTKKIAEDYIKRNAKLTDAHSKWKLMRELQSRCGITEVEAINIMNNYFISDILAHYEREKAKYMDILINGEKPSKKRWRKVKRPEFNPDQITIKEYITEKAPGE